MRSNTQRHIHNKLTWITIGQQQVGERKAIQPADQISRPPKAGVQRQHQDLEKRKGPRAIRPHVVWPRFCSAFIVGAPLTCRASTRCRKRDHDCEPMVTRWCESRSRMEWKTPNAASLTRAKTEDPSTSLLASIVALGATSRRHRARPCAQARRRVDNKTLPPACGSR